MNADSILFIQHTPILYQYHKGGYSHMSKPIFLTEEGLAALEQELEDLKSVKRKEIAEKIKVALSFGDLSENSEYDEATKPL